MNSLTEDQLTKLTICGCGNISTPKPHKNTYYKKDGTVSVYFTVDKRCNKCREEQKHRANRNRKKYANDDKFILSCF